MTQATANLSTNAQTETAAPTPTLLPRLKRFHFFLARNAFYPLVLCSLLAVAFLITRSYLLGYIQYKFLIWNLFLAWIPYFFSLLALRMENWRKRDRAAKAFVWCCWLAMFPNAPYIITDFIHLYEIPPLTWWFDLGMVLTFALAGFFLGIVSLRTMQDLVRPKLGAVIGWLFVAVASLLSGFGVYLGRFQRFNSWDILTKPQRVFVDIIQGLTRSRPYGVTLMFGALTFVTYIMFVSTSRPPESASRKEEI